jgi:hypothetical protein
MTGDASFLLGENLLVAKQHNAAQQIHAQFFRWYFFFHNGFFE